MPANRANFIVLFREDSQVYGCSTKRVALETPPPVGFSIEDKIVLFVTYSPDEGELQMARLPEEEVRNAKLKYRKSDPRYVETEEEDEDDDE